MNLAAQFPFYSVETTTVCADSAGVQSTLIGLNLYTMGRTETYFLFYIDPQGNKVVPGGSVTIYDSPCWEIIQGAEADAITFENSFPAIGGDYTIAANTYSSITIVNTGASNHLVTVDGGAMRLTPGEHYYFFSEFDPVDRLWKANPEIIIYGTGTIGITNLRVYLQPK